MKSLFKSNKKGVVDQLQPLVIALVSVGITLIVGFLIMANINSNTAVRADGNATNATADVINAMADIPEWLPIIVITLIGALLIALVGVFRGRR